MMTTEWTVNIVLATDEPLPEDTLINMDVLAEKWEASVSARGPDGPGYSLIVDISADDPGYAANEAVVVVNHLNEHASISARFVEFHVTTPELFEKRALAPDFPPLASATDAAEILGVSRQRVHQLHASNTRFPAPVARVATGPLWTVPAIEHFADVWVRKSKRTESTSAATTRKFKGLANAGTARTTGKAGQFPSSRREFQKRHGEEPAASQDVNGHLT